MQLKKFGNFLGNGWHIIAYITRIILSILSTLQEPTQVKKQRPNTPDDNSPDAESKSIVVLPPEVRKYMQFVLPISICKINVNLGSYFCSVSLFCARKLFLYKKFGIFH